MTDRALSAAALARRLGVHPHKVLGWIRSGELRAVDLAERRGGRPRWKIMPAALDEFLSARQSQPPTPRRRRRRQTAQRYYT
ncbi:MAG: helix-turn-helix domain-containing protein [Thermoguttaceae bacterium]|jgi:transposase|nr:helix-turn-helix domain-containing protein [Thermoguttaceae bacterium]